MSNPLGGQAKENANPTIYAVQNGRDGGQRQQHLLHQMNFFTNDDGYYDMYNDDGGAYTYIDRFNLPDIHNLDDDGKIIDNVGDDDEDDVMNNNNSSSSSMYSTAWRVRSNLARTAEERS
eukprot:4939038-Ditylum_brightwellii.AAC.1